MVKLLHTEGYFDRTGPAWNVEIRLSFRYCPYLILIAYCLVSFRLILSEFTD